MQIVEGTYKEWAAVYCYWGDCALVAGISKGPRILCFSYRDGPNLLYEDHTGFHVGDWQLYGGHRFTVAPESDRSYHPDNIPCTITYDRGTLVLEAPRTTEGIQKIVRVTAGASGNGFDIQHLLVNNGNSDWTGAVWGITCIPPMGSVEGGIDTSNLQVWPGTKQGLWQIGGNRITVRPDGSRGKIGWYGAYPWIASVTPRHTFTIRVPERGIESECVDGGCNLELFFCGDYYELETLSEKVVLPPGHSIAHIQQWRISD